MKSEDVLTVTNEGVELPNYASEEAAGADVRAYILIETTIFPGKSKLIPTGLKFEIPKGYEIQVRPRSGLALKYGITVLNTPGTIDSDYRGEVGIILINHSSDPFIVQPNMRIAQLVFSPVVKANFIKKSEDLLTKTQRGQGGFGHTGTN